MGITCVSAAHEVGLILPKKIQDVLYKAHDSAWFACRFGLYDQRRS